LLGLYKVIGEYRFCEFRALFILLELRLSLENLFFRSYVAIILQNTGKNNKKHRKTIKYLTFLYLAYILEQKLKHI